MINIKNKFIVSLLIILNLLACSNPSQNITPKIDINISPNEDKIVSTIQPNKPTNLIPTINPSNEINSKIGIVKLLLKNNIDYRNSFDTNNFEKDNKFKNESNFYFSNLLIDSSNNLYSYTFENYQKINLDTKNKTKLNGYYLTQDPIPDNESLILETKEISEKDIDWSLRYMNMSNKDDLYILSYNKNITKISSNKKVTQINLKNDIYTSIAIDNNDNIYISSLANGFIKKISPSFQELWERNTSNTNNEKIYLPTNLTSDKKGNIFFFDTKDLKIKQISEDGKEITNIIGGGDKEFSENINAKDYKISSKYSKFSFDNNGNIYLLERDTNQILKYDFQTEELTLFAGDGKIGFRGENELAKNARFNKPVAIVFDKSNNAYVLDSGNLAIRKIDNNNQRISTFLGQNISHGDGNDLSKIFFYDISGLYAKNNEIYVSEQDRIRKFDGKSIITIAGNGVRPPYETNLLKGIKATEASVLYPRINYIDKNSNIYTMEYLIDKNGIFQETNIKNEYISSDVNNNFYISNSGFIKKIGNTSSELIAGKETSTGIDNTYTITSGMSSLDKELSISSSVSDSQGNVFAICEYKYSDQEIKNSETNKVVVKITTDKKLYVIAGNAEPIKNYSLESLYNAKDPLSIPINPEKLFIDKEDNLYIVDQLLEYRKISSELGSEKYDVEENSIVIRKIDKSRDMSIYAGKISPIRINDTFEVSENPEGKKSNDILMSKINNFDLFLDESANIYFRDSNNNIYKIDYN